MTSMMLRWRAYWCYITSRCLSSIITYRLSMPSVWENWCSDDEEEEEEKMLEDKYDNDHCHHNIVTAKLSYTESVHCSVPAVLSSYLWKKQKVFASSPISVQHVKKSSFSAIYIYLSHNLWGPNLSILSGKSCYSLTLGNNIHLSSIFLLMKISRKPDCFAFVTAWHIATIWTRPT